MLPTDQVYGTWAGSGEIDIFEYRGQRQNESVHTVHMLPWPQNYYISSGEVQHNFLFSKDFHVLTFEWTKTLMTWSIDGTKVWEQTLGLLFPSH